MVQFASSTSTAPPSAALLPLISPPVMLSTEVLFASVRRQMAPPQRLAVLPVISALPEMVMVPQPIRMAPPSRLEELPVICALPEMLIVPLPRI